MKVTQRTVRRIINEEIVRKLSENKAYDRLYAKYDEISDMHSMTDGSNALANDLTDDQYNQMDGYTQDLDWDEQLDWINDNHPEWLEAIAATLPKEKKKKSKKGKKSTPVPTWFEGNYWDHGRGKADMDQYETDLAAAKQFDYILSRASIGKDQEGNLRGSSRDDPSYRYQGILERWQADGILGFIAQAIEEIAGGTGLFTRDLPADPVYDDEGPAHRGVERIILDMAENAAGTGRRWVGENYFYGQPASEEEAEALSEIIKILTDARRYKYQQPIK